MQILLMGLALFQSQGYNEQDYRGGSQPPPLMVTVPVAATNPEFMDRPIEVCGHVTAFRPDRNEAEMFGSGKWLIVDTRGRAELVVRRAACVTGVIRRRDGENELQRRANGLGHTAVSHAASPDFLLYQCHDPASCDRLMQPGPVRPEQLDIDDPQAAPGQRGISS